MNPLAAHHEKQEKPPLITQVEDEGTSRKRPFSNCMLFVLLAVFVFVLGCFAVYTAVAMGVSVEKNQTTPQPLALNKNGLVLSDNNSNKSLPDETKDTESENIFSENIHPKIKIRIVLKGNDLSNKDESESEQGDSLLDSFPSVIFRRITFQNPTKSGEESSGEIVSGSDEGSKEVIQMKPAEKAKIPSAYPNPLEIFNNLFNDDPFLHILNILDKPKKEHSNDKLPEISSEQTDSHSPFEDMLNIFSKQKLEPHPSVLRYEHHEKLPSVNRQPNMRSEEQERLPSENRMKFDPIKDFVNTVDHIISNMEHTRGDENPMGTHYFRGPSIFRFYRFGSPQTQQIGNSNVYSHRRIPSYSNNMRPLSEEDKSSADSSSENNKLAGKTTIKFPTTFAPTTSAPTETFTNPPTFYKEQSQPKSEEKETSTEKLKKPMQFLPKDIPNKTKSRSQQENQHPAKIDRINTDNIEPFENFIKYSKF